MKTWIHKSSRDGISLVELIVILSAASVILSLSAGLIHRVMHSQMKARTLLEIERTSLRLVNSLRADINEAASAVTDSALLANDVFLRLESSTGGRIEYRRENQTIYRLKLDLDRLASHEQFNFSSDFDVSAQSDSPRLIVVTCTSRKEGNVTDSIDPARIANSFTVDAQVVAALQRGGQ